MEENIKNINDFSSKITEAASLSNEQFLTWFDNNENKNSVITSGYRDLSHCILIDKLYDQLKTRSSDLIAMEIGCGSGRITNATAKVFKHVIGLDIHGNLDDTDKFLAEMGNGNTEIKKIENNIFPVENTTIDFIYSFIVFQHLLKLDTFAGYVKEIKRVLKDDGCSIIYFGRPRLFSKMIMRYRTINYLLLALDYIFFENIYVNLFKNGFIEYPDAKTNDVNLILSLRKAKSLFKNDGFKITSTGISKKRNGYGTQYYLLLSK